ncbi:MAG: DUF190 domain-containing protein [Magnetococcales bacterium]|nr:DUF190 domain-containing protein [Magnetococcales bacterium]
MNGLYLKIYLLEKRRVHGLLAYEWLLEQARGMGVHGGTAFRAIAGFGRHGALHEEHFFELAGDLPVEVGFCCGEAEAERLLALVEREGVPCFHVTLAARFGEVTARERETSGENSERSKKPEK